jgi:hypothetical protein
MRPRTRALLKIWLGALMVCAAIVIVSTQISRDMALWGIAASALLLAWLWSRFSRPEAPPPAP